MVRKFKGKVYVDIREFYTGKNGEELPGKKGAVENYLVFCEKNCI